ncbi:MAG: peptide ABC transporter substrate-binding protein [Opitutus sp.]
MNEPGDLDPATATLPDEFFIIRALSEGLVNPAPNRSDENANASVLPGAADRWTVSADGLTYTFHLRENGRWSNGEPVTANDFLLSYRRLLTPATGASKASLFHLVKNARAFATGQISDFSKVGFRAPAADTFEVTLTRPYPKFLIYASSGPWIPVNPRVVERMGRGWTAPKAFVGNGPFTFAEWRPHQHLVVRRNPNYHTPDAVRLDEIRFIVLDNNDTEERAYRAGQIDVTMTVPFAKIETYSRDHAEEFHRTALAETRYLSFNTGRAPLNDPRVRRALSLVIDRRTIVDHVLRGGQQPAFRFVPPSLREPGEHDVAAIPPLSEARTIARQLLADAGFQGGNGFPHLELTTWTVTPVVEVVQQMWKKELGIDVSIVKQDAKVHVTAMREGHYDIGFAPAIPDVADAANILEELISNAPGNYPQWSDAEYDALIEQAKVAPDASTRSTLLQAAEQRLLESSPIAPLYFNAKNWLMSPRIRGWKQDALWTRFYLHVEISDVKR